MPERALHLDGLFVVDPNLWAELITESAHRSCAAASCAWQNSRQLLLGPSIQRRQRLPALNKCSQALTSCIPRVQYLRSARSCGLGSLRSLAGTQRSSSRRRAQYRKVQYLKNVMLLVFLHQRRRQPARACAAAKCSPAMATSALSGQSCCQLASGSPPRLRPLAAGACGMPLLWADLCLPPCVALPQPCSWPRSTCICTARGARNGCRCGRGTRAAGGPLQCPCACLPVGGRRVPLPVPAGSETCHVPGASLPPGPLGPACFPILI